MSRLKNIGIVAITAEGASLCYRTIVTESSKLLGSNKHPEIFLHNPSFHTILEAQKKKDWVKVSDIVCGSIDKKVAVLGVGMTMSDGLYEGPLERNNIKAIVPSAQDQNWINTFIYDEIVPAKISQESIKSLLSIINKLKNEGAEAVILACTELPLVINKNNSPLPFIDTTTLLAQKAVEFSVEK